MGHFHHPFQRIHMARMVDITWPIGRGQASKYMPRKTGNRLVILIQQRFDLSHLARIMIANFMFPDKLQFSIFQPEFIHYFQAMFQIPADTITNYTQFHNDLSSGYTFIDAILPRQFLPAHVLQPNYRLADILTCRHEKAAWQ